MRTYNSKEPFAPATLNKDRVNLEQPMRNSLKLNKDEHQREKELTDAILEYLTEHPQASDTLEGIAEWWVMRQQVRVEIKTLLKVLRQLTGNGLLEKIGYGDEALYHLKAKEDGRHPS
ncbi:hypothetical protein KJ068_00020 [bacterium]|nr:hypothetical protein [bacterium]MDL1876965.1 hypothetical protein [Cytophagia bacterium CHB2]